MKYYDVSYKKPIEHDGYPSLGKLIAMEAPDSATIDDVKDKAKFLLSVGAPWDSSGLEILTVVETPEENLPRPHPQGDFIED